MNVLVTNELLHDIADLSDYIEETFGEKYVELFEEETWKAIRDLENRYHLYPEIGIRYRQQEIRKIVMRPSLIFFVVIQDEIHVLRMLRQERNWERILSREVIYTY